MIFYHLCICRLCKIFDTFVIVWKEDIFILILVIGTNSNNRRSNIATNKRVGTGVPATQVTVTVRDVVVIVERGSCEPINHEGDRTSQIFFLWLNSCTLNK